MRLELPSPRGISATIVAAALTLAGCTQPTPPAAAGKAAAPPADRSAVAEPAVPVVASADLADAGSDVVAQSAYKVVAVDWRWRTDPSGMLMTATSHTLETQHAEWLDAPVAPGSIAKIATLNAALAAGVIDAGTRIVCTRRVTLADGRHADCSHPSLAHALDVVDALGHSCNVFTTTVARRLTREQLSSGLVTMGLPALQTGEDPVAAAIGLGAGRVTASVLLDTLQRAVAGRTAIRDGLARAADAGTASAIGAAGVVAFAKTGTSRMPSGASLGLAIVAAPRPVPTRFTVVLVPGGAGADAAAVAARLLRSYLQPTPQRMRLGRARHDGGYDRVTVDLEDYVAEVVAGESSGETPPAAREALAMAARTFALANRGRHEAEGFDLCSLTHCQVVRPADIGARRAAEATDGRVLQAGGHVVPVFYSAACGGTLDAARALTGGKATTPDRPWMQARPDPAGVAEPGWRTTLEARAFGEALRRAGFRGADLRDLRVDRTADGRVRRVQVSGFEPASISIDDFRRLVGRDLGWQVVRSTSFEVTRTAAGYELQGRGHGHGVGLCVYGASAMARAGRSADELLAAYFPGLTVSAKASTPTALRLRLPAEAERHRTELEATITRELSSLVRETGVKAPQSLTVVVHPTVASYQRATGRAWWTAGVAHIVDGPWVIETIPLAALRTGGRLDSTLRHELAHILIDGEALAPAKWVREGLAMHFAGEHPAPLDGPCPTDSEFVDATRETSAAVYRRAATCVGRALARGVAWRDIGK